MCGYNAITNYLLLKTLRQSFNSLNYLTLWLYFRLLEGKYKNRKC